MRFNPSGIRGFALPQQAGADESQEMMTAAADSKVAELADVMQAETIADRPDGLSHEEEERVQRHRGGPRLHG